MANLYSSILATATDPLFLAGVVTVAGFFGARYWRGRSSLAQFFTQLLVLVILTGLLLAAGVVPYRPSAAVGGESRRLFVGLLEVIWWLGTAWLAVGFLRAFVVLGRQPRETKLVQDLLAALTFKDLSAEMIDFELSYSVADVSVVDWAQNELYGRIYRAAAAAGTKFASRFGSSRSGSASAVQAESGIPERLLAGISLFSTLSTEEKGTLASQMQRKDYQPGGGDCENGHDPGGLRHRERWCAHRVSGGKRAQN
jgi:hypothetical protein